MTDKPKRKNLSPDELLQQAKLLHPENEAFVRGETKNLYAKPEIYANLYDKKGFPLNPENLRDTKRKKSSDMVATLIPSCLIWFLTFGVTTSFLGTLILNFEPALIPSSFCMIPIIGFFMYLSFGVIRNVINIVKTQESDVQTQLSQCIQYGHLITGNAVDIERNYGIPQRTAIVYYNYVSPNTGKIKKGVWHTLFRNHAIEIDDNIILLYLNDNCVIVL